MASSPARLSSGKGVSAGGWRPPCLMCGMSVPELLELADREDVALGVLEPRGQFGFQIGDPVDGLQAWKVVLQELDPQGPHVLHDGRQVVHVPAADGVAGPRGLRRIKKQAGATAETVDDPGLRHSLRRAHEGEGVDEAVAGRVGDILSRALAARPDRQGIGGPSADTPDVIPSS